jgi:hypothetical protein
VVLQAYEYLEQRRAFVQKRFVYCMQYVEVHSENCDAFSYQFASILRDSGSVFSSVLDAMIRGSGFVARGQTNIAHHKSFLKAQDNTIYLASVHFRSRFPDGLILPLYSLKTRRNNLTWWLAYNKVKSKTESDLPFVRPWQPESRCSYYQNCSYWHQHSRRLSSRYEPLRYCQSY